MPALVVAAFVKAIAAITIPFFMLAIWLKESRPIRRVRWLLESLLPIGAILIAVLLPFGPLLENLGGILDEATRRTGYSLAATLVLVVRDWVVVPLTTTLAVPRNTVSALDHYARVVPRWLALGGLAVLYLRQLCMVRRRKRDPIAASAEALFAYVVLAPSFRMWYPAWPMALTALRPTRGRLLRVSTACLTAQLSVLVFGYLIRWDALPRHLLGTGLTLMVPMLVPVMDRWIRQSDAAPFDKATVLG
jgi:hypothetical protein